MPRVKAVKRKVKRVAAVDDSQGKNLTQAERAAKMEIFVAQFDEEVEQRLTSLDKECKALCNYVEATGRSNILQMTPETANMSILEYRKRLLKLKGKETRVSGSGEVNAVLTDTANVFNTKPAAAGKPPAKKGPKVAGFATPAPGASRLTLWTATPKETPLFDKRLLGVVAAGNTKRLDLSVDGQNIDFKNMGHDSKRELANQLKDLLKQLK